MDRSSTGDNEHHPAREKESYIAAAHEAAEPTQHINSLAGLHTGFIHWKLKQSW